MQSPLLVKDASHVLVIGGGGFIGQRICSTLAERAVICDVAAQTAVGRSIFVQRSVHDISGLAETMKEFEITHVVHLVGLPHIPTCQKDPGRSFELNVSSVGSALEAMRLSDVRTMVFASTAAVYGRPLSNPVSESFPTNPLSTYGYHKLLAEKLVQCYVQNYGFSSVVFRIFNVYGGDFKHHDDAISTFIRNAIDGKPLSVTGGNQLRDFVHIEDVSASFTRATHLHNGGFETLNLGSGIPMSILDVAETVRQVFAGKIVNDPKIQSSHYDIFSDNARLRSTLKINPSNPAMGIPDFVKGLSKSVLVA